MTGRQWLALCAAFVAGTLANMLFVYLRQRAYNEAIGVKEASPTTDRLDRTLQKQFATRRNVGNRFAAAIRKTFPELTVQVSMTMERYLITVWERELLRITLMTIDISGDEAVIRRQYGVQSYQLDNDSVDRAVEDIRRQINARL